MKLKNSKIIFQGTYYGKSSAFFFIKWHAKSIKTVLNIYGKNFNNFKNFIFKNRYSIIGMTELLIFNKIDR